MRALKSRGEERYRSSLRAACAHAAGLLKDGAGALDAAVAATRYMEDIGQFNAGLGACLNMDGGIEMDAAVMDGTDRGFGAVAGVRGVANPVVLARHVMEQTQHCVLGGEGAADFARSLALPFRENFPSQQRREEWRRKKQKLEAEGGLEAGGLAALGGVLGDSLAEPAPVDDVADTVGACALDAAGHLASAVSTGGLWLKQAGRIGDSPLPGAGLWALDGLGAAVATGTGETILRMLLCKEVVDRMADGAGFAAQAGIDLLEEQFGINMAGVIAIDARGRTGFAFNTRGMGRALWTTGMDEPAVAVWPGEPWDRVVAARC